MLTSDLMFISLSHVSDLVCVSCFNAISYISISDITCHSFLLSEFLSDLLHFEVCCVSRA